MAGCGCKNGSNIENQAEVIELPKEKVSLPMNIIKYTVRVIAFILSLIIIPFILFFTILLLWHHIVLDNKLDAMALFTAIGKKIKFLGDMQEDDDDIDEPYNPEEEYQLVGVEEVK